jgi:hypothetical protein
VVAKGDSEPAIDTKIYRWRYGKDREENRLIIAKGIGHITYIVTSFILCPWQCRIPAVVNVGEQPALPLPV